MKVSGLGHFALGQSVPSKRHAVCVSLPTVEDLIGYEEKNLILWLQYPLDIPALLDTQKFMNCPSIGKLQIKLQTLITFFS